ncbi:phage tail protein [Gemella sp. GH3]|uniref:phage tail spike protein n=1 Tax=unclassified Gemella TaxID=2624949 RepID=UPI0015D0267C|nr:MULTISPECIES: phage tail spike protein [unclassified Gemella]MBF0714488.1 phage tail protein [Gemella sp. GH3.1]NYS51440.1 phage tail protein [Gemella sp. GH3]
MIYLFDNKENLIKVVNPLECVYEEEINAVQVLRAKIMFTADLSKIYYLGHKDPQNKSTFHLYRVEELNKNTDKTVYITAIHTFFDDMNSDGYIKDYRPNNRTITEIVNKILDGSSWKLGVLKTQKRITTNFYYVSRKEALSKLIEISQVEVRPRIIYKKGAIHERYLDVFDRIGQDSGRVFVHGKDLISVNEKVSKVFYSAAVGRGKGEEIQDSEGQATGGYGRKINFSDVVWRTELGHPVNKPLGQEWVELPNITSEYGLDKGKKARLKIIEFGEEEDPENLLQLTYDWLVNNSRPQVEYSADVLSVGNLNLGDTVGVARKELGIKYKTRVFKIERNLVNRKLSKFILGDKITTSPFSRQNEISKKIDNLENNTIYWLDNLKQRIVDNINSDNGYNYDLKPGNEYNLPAGLYSFNKPINENPTKVIYIGSGRMAIANSKNAQGDWNWSTLADGDGITLNAVNSGILRTGRIESADGRSYWDLDNGVFKMDLRQNKELQNIVEEKVTDKVNEIDLNIPKAVETEISNRKLEFIPSYAWANSPDGVRDFTSVGTSPTAKIVVKNRPRINFTNDNDITDVWQSNIPIKLKPNTTYTMSARCRAVTKTNGYLADSLEINIRSEHFPDNFDYSIFSDIKRTSGQEYLEFTNPTYEIKHTTFTTGNIDPSQIFNIRGMLYPEDGSWLGAGIDWYVLCEGNKTYNDYPTNEPSQFMRYRYFGTGRGVNKPDSPRDYEWMDVTRRTPAQKNIFIKYSNNPDGSNFFNSAEGQPTYMGTAITTSNTAPTDKESYKWAKIKGDDGVIPDRNLLIATEFKNLSDVNLVNTLNAKLNVNDYNGHNSIEWQASNLAANGWRGITVNSSINSLKRGNKIVIRLPIYIFNDVAVDGGIKLRLKNHKKNTTLKEFNLSEGTPTNQWFIKELKFTAENNFNFEDYNSFYISIEKNGHVKIAEPYMSYGSEVPKMWSPALIDLQGHSLTGNLRLEGSYLNNNLTGFKAFVDVYYDGSKITSGFTVKTKYKGIGMSAWTEFKNTTYNSDGYLHNLAFPDGVRDGSSFEVIALISYKDLNVVANARLDNTVDVRVLKETVEKIRDFQSDINGLRSSVGEVTNKIGTVENSVHETVSLIEQTKNSITLSVADAEKRLSILEPRPNIAQFQADVITGSDQYHPVIEDLEAYQLYTLVFDVGNLQSGVDLNPRIYNSIDAKGQSLIDKDNVFVFSYNPEKLPKNRKINLYPLNDKVNVKNVRIYKGDWAWWFKKDKLATNDDVKSAVEVGINKVAIKTVEKGKVIAEINQSREGTKISGGAIVDDLYGKTITGATIQGNSKIKLGTHGFLQPVENGLQINAPATSNANYGVGLQVLGQGYSKNGKNYPKGLFIYPDDNFSVGSTTYRTNEVLLTVNGMIEFSSYRDGNGNQFEGYGIPTRKSADKNGAPIMYMYHDWQEGYETLSYFRSGGWVTVRPESNSDVRLKKNIQSTKVNASSVIKNIDFVEFDWKDAKKRRETLGVIAQQLEQLDPTLIDKIKDEDSRYILNSPKILMYALKGVQELIEQNQKLEDRMSILESKFKLLLKENE